MAKRFIAFLAVFATATVFAFAASPVGTWVGAFKFDIAKIKMPKDPQQLASAKAALEAIKKMKFTFILKADKTFRMEMRSVQAGKPHIQLSEGTYTLAGNKVTTTTLKREGKPVPANDQTKNTLVMSADGNSMVHTKIDPTLQGRIELKRAKK